MDGGKEKLVVEVVGAHNLMPKDGEGSCSAFVEVEFEHQKQRTQVVKKDLNPIWNEKLFFDISDVSDLPYRMIEANIYNAKRSTTNRYFLGKIRVSGSNAGIEGQQVAQMFPLDKRSLFSHIRGEIAMKIYVSTQIEVRDQPPPAEVVEEDAVAEQQVSGSASGSGSGSGYSKKKKNQQQNSPMLVQQQQNQSGQPIPQNQNRPPRQMEPKPGEIHPEPAVLAGRPVPAPKPAAAPRPVPGPTVSVAAPAGIMYPNGPPTAAEFSLKETNPHLGGGPLNRDKTSSTYDLVEQMQYLYVRVVKAREIPLFGAGEIVAEVKLGNYRGMTKRASLSNIEWDQVFAFSKDCIQSSMVEVLIKEGNRDDYFGRIYFDLNEVPKRAPPDSQLAPSWVRMEDPRGQKLQSEVMVAVWFGTQADEAFSEAWHSKQSNVHFDGLGSIKSKVYLSPKLWYLRVNVIEAQDIIPAEKGPTMKYPELFAKVQIGNQTLMTKVSAPSSSRSFSNPFWNEDLMFVVAEPFEDYLIVSVQDRVGSGKDEVVGRVVFPVASVARRFDNKEVDPRWFNLDNDFGRSPDHSSLVARFGSRVHLRICLEGGYHVIDEAATYSSDLRPTAKELWSPRIGVLEVGILEATGLMPMKLKEGNRSTTDAYCVAKYGQKWVRTRTVVDSLMPKWNEQYTWEVFDPCTVITIGVFDNCRSDRNVFMNSGGKDARIGKVRIRLSTLETDRVYTHSYPLLMLFPNGVKKMGELHLAVRFSCANLSNMFSTYTLPLLPKMHYLLPISVCKMDFLRNQATQVVISRLSRAEPPLGREVVEYMLDTDSHMWSMRKSKANFYRIMSFVSGLLAIYRAFKSIRSWKKPVHSALFVAAFLILVIYPDFIVPAMLLVLAVFGLWQYKSRPRHPPHMSTKHSDAESLHPEMLDEEFDTFPTSRSTDVVRMRYDRLRSIGGRLQTVAGDLASQVERVLALVSWRDPRATFLFIVFCVVAAVGIYAVPMKLWIALWGMYALRPPRFRSKLPSCPLNFFRRLPSDADTLL